MIRLLVEFNMAEREEVGLAVEAPATFEHLVEMKPKVVDGKWRFDVTVPGGQPGQAERPTYQELLSLIDRKIKWIPPLRHLAPESFSECPEHVPQP